MTFNLALLLQQNNKHAEAVEYWRRYLANDAQSEWAARARRSLKILRNATATLLTAAVFQVAACNAPPPLAWPLGRALARYFGCKKSPAEARLEFRHGQGGWVRPAEPYF
jgi:hypothetical protein